MRDNEVDEVAARELQLWIENDGDLYRQQYEPINKNLARKKFRGIYEHDKTIKLFMYLVDNGAKSYNKMNGDGTEKIPSYFNKATRMKVAENLTNYFETEFSLGNYDHYKQKHLKKEYACGGFVKQTGYAKVHKGELVIPRETLNKVVKTSRDYRADNGQGGWFRDYKKHSLAARKAARTRRQRRWRG